MKQINIYKEITDLFRHLLGITILFIYFSLIKLTKNFLRLNKKLANLGEISIIEFIYTRMNDNF